MKLGSAVFWTLSSVALTSAIKLLGNLTLARMLTADAFGLVAIVFAITSGIEAITDVGTTPSLIRSQRTDKTWLDTAWTLGILRGVGIAVVVCLAAYPVASFFNDDRLAPLIAASAIMSVFIGLKSNQAILAVRNLQSRTVAIVELSAAILGYLVMLVWAWISPTAWALLAGALVTTGASSVLSFWAFDRRHHRFCWDKPAITELVSFGKWVFFASLLGFFILQGDRFVIAKFRGLHDVGIYSIAISWAMALHQLFLMFLSRLYLPVVAQFKRLNSGAEAVARLRYFILAAMILPYALFAGTAEQLIGVLYPSSFAEAGVIMGVLMIWAWFSALEFIYNDQLMLAGEPAWRAYAQILSMLVIGIGLFLFASQLNLLFIAAIFAAGATVRGVMLLLINDRSRIRKALPDLTISLVFLLFCVAIRGASQFVALRYSPFLALVACTLVIAPVAAAIGWMAIRRALDLAASLSTDKQAETSDTAEISAPVMPA
jgi:O-antigen/teichoic acid export membrane protein